MASSPDANRLFATARDLSTCPELSSKTKATERGEGDDDVHPHPPVHTRPLSHGSPLGLGSRWVLVVACVGACRCLAEAARSVQGSRLDTLTAY